MSSTRIKCIVSYDGTNYYGFQKQDKFISVEETIEKALFKMLKKETKIYASGRTDRFVHARGQVFHFDTELNIPDIGIVRGLNGYLPNDIRILSASHVDDTFHARFSAVGKEYRYYIKHTSYSVFDRNYCYFYKGLDLELLKEAASKFVGTHNFRGFCSLEVDPRKNFVKTIFSVKVNVLNDYYEIIFIGTGFLKYQIRRMTGLIIEIARKKEKMDKIDLVFKTLDPRDSHSLAPGQGLYLERVFYNEKDI